MEEVHRGMVGVIGALCVLLRVEDLLFRMLLTMIGIPQPVSLATTIAPKTLPSHYQQPRNDYQLQRLTTTSLIQSATLKLHYKLAPNIYELLCHIIAEFQTPNTFYAIPPHTTLSNRIRKQVLVYSYEKIWVRS